MRAFVESLKRLYEKERIGESKILEMEDTGKLNFSETIYITGGEAGGGKTDY